MKGPLSRLSLILLLAGLAAGAPLAQGPGPPVDDDLAEAIEQLMIARLRTHLELSAGQEEEVVPLVEDLTELRRRHGRARAEGMRSIMALAQDRSVEERLLKERLEAFYAQESEFRRQEEELTRGLRARLEPRQQARLLVFEQRFRGEMRRRIEEMRGRRGGPDRPGLRPGRGGRPRPPRGDRPGRPPGR